MDHFQEAHDIYTQGKAGNMEITLPVTEWPGFFLSYMLYLPSVIMEKLLHFWNLLWKGWKWQYGCGVGMEYMGCLCGSADLPFRVKKTLHISICVPFLLL